MGNDGGSARHMAFSPSLVTAADCGLQRAPQPADRSRDSVRARPLPQDAGARLVGEGTPRPRPWRWGAPRAERHDKSQRFSVCSRSQATPTKLTLHPCGRGRLEALALRRNVDALALHQSPARSAAAGQDHAFAGGLSRSGPDSYSL